MGWQPGGTPPPPPPPPVPPNEPPRSPWDAPPGPKQRDPIEPGRPAIVAGIAVALAVSLAVNVILALRVKDESDQQARLRARITALEQEIDTLKRAQPQDSKTVLERIAAAVEQLRALKFKGAVKSEVLTDDQLAARVDQQFRSDAPRAEVDDNDAILTALGLLGRRDDLWEILLGVQREQVAGFYDTDKKILVVGGDAKNPTPLDRVLLAHEYVHALTDQHYDLSRLDKLDDARKDDEATAYRALIEGDATVMMFNYAARYLTTGDRVEVQRELSSSPSQKFEAAPKAIRESILFPYQEGERFVRSLLDAGGISELNKAYKDPPTSTEQILHVSRYLGRRDEPSAVAMPDLARALGTGWKGLRGGGIGEFDVRLIAGQFLPRRDADEAGSGWDGGRFAAADSSAGTVVAALTVWDSESEAREATEILSRWLPARYGNRGSNVRVTGATGRGWDSPTGAGTVTRDGKRILLVVGPNMASVDKARSAFPGL